MKALASILKTFKKKVIWCTKLHWGHFDNLPFPLIVYLHLFTYANDSPVWCNAYVGVTFVSNGLYVWCINQLKKVALYTLIFIAL